MIPHIEINIAQSDSGEPILCVPVSLIDIQIRTASIDLTLRDQNNALMQGCASIFLEKRKGCWAAILNGSGEDPVAIVYFLDNGDVALQECEGFYKKLHHTDDPGDHLPGIEPMRIEDEQAVESGPTEGAVEPA